MPRPPRVCVAGIIPWLSFGFKRLPRISVLGTGTQSGPTRGEEGCLLELSHGGKQPLPLADGQTRSFVEDGDTVILRGWCEAPGAARIGFGECRGTVLAAVA